MLASRSIVLLLLTCMVGSFGNPVDYNAGRSFGSTIWNWIKYPFTWLEHSLNSNISKQSYRYKHNLTVQCNENICEIVQCYHGKCKKIDCALNASNVSEQCLIYNFILTSPAIIEKDSAEPTKWTNSAEKPPQEDNLTGPTPTESIILIQSLPFLSTNDSVPGPAISVLSSMQQNLNTTSNDEALLIPTKPYSVDLQPKLTTLAPLTETKEMTSAQPNLVLSVETLTTLQPVSEKLESPVPVPESMHEKPSTTNPDSALEQSRPTSALMHETLPALEPVSENMLSPVFSSVSMHDQSPKHKPEYEKLDPSIPKSTPVYDIMPNSTPISEKVVPTISVSAMKSELFYQKPEPAMQTVAISTDLVITQMPPVVVLTT